MHLSDTSCVFNLTSHTKTRKPGKPASTITVQEFKQDCRICPIKTLKQYLKGTDTIRGDEQQLFISFVKLYKSVSRDTISRWAKIVLQRSRIDTVVYKPQHKSSQCFQSQAEGCTSGWNFIPSRLEHCWYNSENSMVGPSWQVMITWPLQYWEIRHWNILVISFNIPIGCVTIHNNFSFATVSLWCYM